MRRAFLLALVALAAPAARAQTTTTAAPITFTEGTNDLVHGPWISLAECNASKTTPATATVNMGWVMANFPVGGDYQMYATDADPTGKATCPITDVTGGSTGNYFAGAVGSPITGQTGSVNNIPIEFADVFGAIKLADCAVVTADKQIWICAQARDSNQNAVSGAIAIGRLTLSITAPAAPPSVSAVAADTGALQISWSAPTGSPPAYDYRISASSTTVCATPTDPNALCDPNTHQATDLRTLSYIMDGLTLGATYTVDVYPRSEAGNEGPKNSASAQAVKVANFWDVCHDPPYSCPEQGGCGLSQAGAAGAAGAGSLALLAVAALFAKLRRRA